VVQEILKKHIQKNIYPGEFYVTNRTEIISTVLGSCIAVCLYDEVNRVCGMNHFMLPEKPSNIFINKEYQFTDTFFESNSLRYGSYAMELLVNSVIKAGGEKKFLKAKIFGGSNILFHNRESKTIGEQNIEFILAYLKAENIKLISSDIGGIKGRKILFYTGKYSVFVKKIPITQVPKEEIKTVKPGDITLF